MYILYTFYTYFIHIQMACYIMFGGFHNDFKNNFINVPLQLAPLLTLSHKMVKHTQTNRRQIADELFECV